MCEVYQILATSEIKATIKKATPAQNMLPVRNQTIIATMAAGNTNRKILASTTIITIPTINSKTNTAMSISGPKT